MALSSVKRLPKQQIRVMFDRAKQMEKEGRHIIHLEIGRPDFNTPDHIVAAAVEALRTGKHHYCPNAGIPELRQAVSEKVADPFQSVLRENNLPGFQGVPTSGRSQRSRPHQRIVFRKR